MKHATLAALPGVSIAGLLTVALSAPTCHAHGVVGKRFLPATITLDDPFVSDELSVVAGHRKLPGESGDEGDASGIHASTLSAEFSKRVTADFGISVGTTYQRIRTSGDTQPQYGFDNSSLSLKYQLIRNAEHEALVSFGVDADLGGTGSRHVGAESFSTVSPTLFYGKGFGDLPDAARYLRPLAVTGVLAPELPTRRSEPDRLNWGFTVQYSLQYLQAYVKDIGLGAPFNRMILLVEVPVRTCLGNGCAGQTTGTVNPGLMWFGTTVQVGVEAAIPLNSRSGHDVGVFLQLHLFLDDVFPTSIGKPIFH